MEGVPKSDSDDVDRRTLARSQLDVRHLGCIPWMSSRGLPEIRSAVGSDTVTAAANFHVCARVVRLGVVSIDGLRNGRAHFHDDVCADRRRGDGRRCVLRSRGDASRNLGDGRTQRARASRGLDADPHTSRWPGCGRRCRARRYAWIGSVPLPLLPVLGGRVISFLRKAFLLGLVGAVVLAAGETMARLDDAIRSGTPLLASPSYTDLTIQDSLGTRGRPFARYEKWRLNGAGFRNQEVALAPTPNCARVAVMGASETFGYAESPGKEYPAQLADSLNRSGCYEVLNTA